MSLNSSRRASKTKKESIFREIGSGMFISIRTIDELEDIISTSEAYMTDPTAIFNSDNTKVLFYYNTKGRNEIEEMETLFKRTVKKGSTITLSDAFYLDESSGDDTTYDLSGTYKFEKYDTTTKTIIASPISINNQSDTNLTYQSKYWTGSLLWTTSDPIHTRTSSYEIINFLGNATEHSFESVFGNIQKNDKIEVEGLGTYTVVEYKVDADEEWERIVVKEPIPEKDLLGEKTFISILRTDRNQPTTKGRKPKITLIRDYSKIQCDTTYGVHWMGPDRGGFCMDGAKHQQSRSTDDGIVCLSAIGEANTCAQNLYRTGEGWVAPPPVEVDCNFVRWFECPCDEDINNLDNSGNKTPLRTVMEVAWEACNRSWNDGPCQANDTVEGTICHIAQLMHNRELDGIGSIIPTEGALSNCQQCLWDELAKLEYGEDDGYPECKFDGWPNFHPPLGQRAPGTGGHGMFQPEPWARWCTSACTISLKECCPCDEGPVSPGPITPTAPPGWTPRPPRRPDNPLNLPGWWPNTSEARTSTPKIINPRMTPPKSSGY